MLTISETENIFTEQVELRQKLVEQARKFLYDNQECYVAQWILQNPYADIKQYRLKFVYNDASRSGYSVEMEEIENV